MLITLVYLFPVFGDFGSIFTSDFSASLLPKHMKSYFYITQYQPIYF